MRNYKKGARVLKGVAFTVEEFAHIRALASHRGCSATQVIRDCVRHVLQIGLSVSERRPDYGVDEEALAAVSAEPWRTRRP